MLPLPLLLHAQNGSGLFLQNGKKWNYYSAAVEETYGWGYYALSVGGDTIVGSHVCKMIVKSPVFSGDAMVALLYEKDKKVFEIPLSQTDNKARLLYDFSLECGGSAYDEASKTQYTVTAVDTVSCLGRKFRRQYLSSGDSQAEWIEGVGSKRGLLNALSCPDGDDTRLVSCEKDGVTLFATREADSPTPADRYIPLVEEGKTWVYTDVSADSRDISYLIGGDTIIAGRGYKKLYEKRGLHGEYRYYGALREPDRRVYLLMAGESQEHLLYDFYLSVPLDECEDETGLVSRLGDVIRPLRTENGSQLRIYNVLRFRPGSHLPVTGYTPWVEGVGAQDRLPFPKAGQTRAWLLGCYDADGVCICKREDLTDEDWLYYPYPVLQVPRKPVAVEGRRWEYGLAGTGEPVLRQWIEGDTIIGGQRYALLYEQRGDDEPRLCGAMRESQCDFGWVDSCKVYCYDLASQQEHLLMRQGMVSPEGYPPHTDKQQVYEPMTGMDRTFTMALARNISSADHTYRVMHLLTAEGDTLRWVEGIGYEERGLLSGADAANYTLLSCYDDETCIYSTVTAEQPFIPDDIKDLPTPSSLRHALSSSAVYDLQGRRLNGVPQRGVYIRDGRKVVVK